MNKPQLVAETPRAGKWNHRFIAAPNGSFSDSEVAKMIAAARRNPQGDDYLAVIAETTQSMSGRTGKEILALTGVDVKKLSDNQRQQIVDQLEQQLTDLATLVTEEIDWDKEGQAILVKRPELGEWEKRFVDLPLFTPQQKAAVSKKPIVFHKNILAKAQYKLLVLFESIGQRIYLKYSISNPNRFKIVGGVVGILLVLGVSSLGYQHFQNSNNPDEKTFSENEPEPTSQEAKIALEPDNSETKVADKNGQGAILSQGTVEQTAENLDVEDNPADETASNNGSSVKEEPSENNKGNSEQATTTQGGIKVPNNANEEQKQQCSALKEKITTKGWIENGNWIKDNICYKPEIESPLTNFKAFLKDWCRLDYDPAPDDELDICLSSNQCDTFKKEKMDQLKNDFTNLKGCLPKSKQE
jgi:hypothetical protein